MPRVRNNNPYSCREPGCLATFKNVRDRTKHEGMHYIQFGHKNAFTCEVCCVQFYRPDNLNVHRMAIHGLEKMEDLFVVVEYCGSFKLVRSEGMRQIGKRNVIYILSFITILDDGQGVFNARYMQV